MSFPISSFRWPGVRRAQVLGLVLGCGLVPRSEALAQPGRAATDRFEETSPSVTWTGSWAKNSLPANSGGSARLSMETMSRVDFSFTGTGVRWLGYRDEWSGIADVLLDGRLRATVDTLSSPAVAQVEIYAIEGLRDGQHTLTIRPTGRKHRASGGAWIWVDAFLIR